MTATNKRSGRQAAIRQLLRSQELKTQKALCAGLLDCGFDCTQATVSRDVVELGLIKNAAGVYQLPEDMRLQSMVQQMGKRVQRAQNLVVMHTMAGTAQGVAAALDGAELPGILGSVAGDDTILVIAETELRAAAFEAAIETLIAGEGGTQLA